MKQISRIVTVLSIIMLYSLSCAFGQGQDPQPLQLDKDPVVIPPSPTAAGLGKYGEIPVSKSKGLANISVPLYTIQIGQYQLPISLSYHSGGIKVEEEASWVGLGWSLNAGGVITRSVKGIQDDLYLGYAMNENIIADLLANDIETHQDTYGNKLIDLEPDLYFFSVAGYTGKFFIDNITDDIHFMPNNSDVHFERLGTHEFKMLDPNGNTYYFGGDTTYLELTSTAIQTDLPESMPDFSEHVSSMFLSKIVTLNNEVIEFKYNPHQTSGKSYIQSQSKFALLNTDNYCYSNIPDDYTTTCAINHESIHLDSIIFKQGYILFEDNHVRNDLSNTNTALTKVKIYNDNRLLKEWEFSYDYFGNTNSFETCRLKLLSLQMKNGFVTQPPYIFDYNTTELPIKSSMAQDYWGYYNGQNNTTLIPSIIGLDPNLGTANREPSSYAQASILNKITFPTGGYTTFDYEANDYDVTNNSAPIYGVFENNKSITVYYDTHPVNESIDFNINLTQDNIQIEFRAWNDQQPEINGELTLERVFPDGSTEMIWSGGNQPTTHVETVGLAVNKPAIAAGDYRLTGLAVLPGDNVSATVRYQEQSSTPIYKKIAGGLRIKRISSFDNKGGSIIKEYEYTRGGQNGTSSGYLINLDPISKYASIYNFLMYELTETTKIDVYNVHQCIAGEQSSSNASLFGASNEIVSYEQVLERTIGSTDNGSILERYSRVTDIGGDAKIQPNERSWLRDLLIDRSVFNANGDPIIFEEYTYNTDFGHIVDGYQLRPQWHSNNPADNGVCNIHTYSYRSDWVQLESVTTTEYFYPITGVETKVNSTEYEYNTTAAHHLPILERTTKSNGDIHIIEKKYPFDYVLHSAADSNAVRILDLQQHHIYNEIIEQTQLLQQGSNEYIIGSIHREFDNLLLNRMYTINNDDLANSYNPTYSAYGNRMFIVDTYEPKLIFDLYDTVNFNNLLQYHIVDGVTTSFIYGYNYSLPIAKVVNATYTEVTQALGYSVQALQTKSDSELQSIFKNLRDHSSMSDALITSFTYEPLVGMTSSTNERGITTIYEYDELQRLVNVKNDDGDIVQSTDYNYFEYPFLDLDKETQDVAPSGGTFNINISTNVGEYTIDYNGANWFSHSITGNVITFTVDPNPASNRSATVTFSGSEVSDQLIISQDELVLSADFSNVVDLRSLNQSFTIPVTSNGTWTVSKTAHNWFSISPTSGTNNGTITVTCIRELSSSDSGTLTITNGVTTLTKTINFNPLPGGGGPPGGGL